MTNTFWLSSSCSSDSLMLVAKSKVSEPTTVPTSDHPSKTLPGASQHPSKTLSKSHVCHLALTTLILKRTKKLRSYFHTCNLLTPVPFHYFCPNNVLLPVPHNWNLSSFAACSSFLKSQFLVRSYSCNMYKTIWIIKKSQENISFLDSALINMF